MLTKTYKTGFNRGNARVWLEGAVLLQHGILLGMPFKRDMNETVRKSWPTERSSFVLVFDDDSDDLVGDHHVAGTEERPIIDLCGKWLTECFDGAPHYDAKAGEPRDNQPPAIFITRRKSSIEIP